MFASACGARVFGAFFSNTLGLERPSLKALNCQRCQTFSRAATVYRPQCTIHPLSERLASEISLSSRLYCIRKVGRATPRLQPHGWKIQNV